MTGFCVSPIHCTLFVHGSVVNPGEVYGSQKQGHNVIHRSTCGTRFSPNVPESKQCLCTRLEATTRILDTFFLRHIHFVDTHQGPSLSLSLYLGMQGLLKAWPLTLSAHPEVLKVNGISHPCCCHPPTHSPTHSAITADRW